jgi:hypothetical protein
MRRVVFVLALAGALGAASIANAGCSLSHDELAAARAQLSQEPYNCTCTGNHGRYVSCVARAVNDLVRNHGFPVNCKGAVTRCAARSTCGKKTGFVTCAVCSPGTCTDNHCDDGVTFCSDSSTCPPVLNRCSTKSDAALCQPRQDGTFTVPGSGSCCDATCALD